MNTYDSVQLDPRIWGPPYWFFLHTIALTYPEHPNSITKKKYYEFLQYMLPLFLPNEHVATNWESLLNEYPVSPYLDKRDDFIRWMHFIHNQINKRLEKPEQPLDKALKEHLFQPLNHRAQAWKKTLNKLIYFTILSCIAFIIYKHS